MCDWCWCCERGQSFTWMEEYEEKCAQEADRLRMQNALWEHYNLLGQDYFNGTFCDEEGYSELLDSLSDEELEEKFYKLRCF